MTEIPSDKKSEISFLYALALIFPILQALLMCLIGGYENSIAMHKLIAMILFMVFLLHSIRRNSNLFSCTGKLSPGN